MGCSESTEVLENANRSKPVFNVIEKAETFQKNFFLMGEIAKNKHIFVAINETDGSMKNINLPQNFKPKNFSSVISIGESLYFISGGVNYSLSNISSQCFIFNIKKNEIIPVESMKQERYTHQSLFYEGWVYVLGGRHFGDDNTAILNHCEKFNLSERKWVPMPKMNIKRCTFLTLVWNQKIYAFGGYTGEYQRSRVIEYLDIGSNKEWKTLKFQLNRGIQSAFLVSTNDNQVTIFGGNTNSGPTDSVFTLNLAQNTVRSCKKLKDSKILHKGLYDKGKVFLFGGNEHLNMEEYDLIKLSSSHKNTALKQKFSQQQFQSLSHPESSVCVPFSLKPSTKVESEYGDEIVFIFGTTQEPFILELNISVPYAAYHAVPLSLSLHALQGGISLKNKKFLLFGGIEDSLENVSSQTYIYDHDKGQGHQISSMTTSRYAFAFTQMKGFVYALGGGTSDQEGQLMILKQCQRLDLKKQTWFSIAPLPVGVISSMCLVHKETLYVFGGMRQNKQRYQNIVRYDQKNNTWNELQFTFPFGLEASSIYQRKPDQFLIFGGRTVNGDTKGIWSLSFAGDDFVFAEQGQMNERKCLHKIYQPRHQNFLVLFGGEKHPLSYYDSQSLKPFESDILAGMKGVFEENLSMLHYRSLKNYLILAISQ